MNRPLLPPEPYFFVILRAVVRIFAVITVFCGSHARAQNSDLAIAARIGGLLAAMTLEEKVGQLDFKSRADPPTGQIDLVRAGRVGAMLNVIDPHEVAAFQTAARQSRLGIPLLLGLDAVNVFRIAFASPLAWAATWEPMLAARAAEMVARETAAVGINWTFAPMVDLSRDPRWGRVIEGAGEDPVLAAAMARARVEGYRRGGLATAVKHFVGYGAAEAGRDYNGARIPMSELYDRYLPPFEAAIAAGSETVMAAFNTVNGVPVSSSRELLSDLLRRRLGFDGLVTSDYNAIGELINHGVAADPGEAALKALAAGIDLDMEGGVYESRLADLVRSGRVEMAALDAAVARVLRVKLRMGLFDKVGTQPPSAPLEAEVRSVARAVAQRSLVLLKNDGDVLPIASGVRRVALIGASALGDYDLSWWGPARLTRPATETLKAALERVLRPGQTLTYAPAFSDACGRAFADKQAAIATAAAADLVVLAVAEDCETWGEGASRTQLGLSGVQQEMLAALAATGRPVVLLVDTGRPLVLGEAARHAAAILVSWQGGTEGRTAIAETLVGDAAPSAKLPMGFPRAVGQLPMSYDELPTSRPPGRDRFTSRYLDEEAGPLFPFGHGLSYTRFAFSDLRATPEAAASGGRVTVTVRVANVGARSGEEVVQVYVRQLVASRSRPVRQLKAFAKVRLRPGEARDVSFEIAARDLGFHDDEGRRHVEPGPYQLWAGGSAAASLSARFALTGAAQVEPR